MTRELLAVVLAAAAAALAAGGGSPLDRLGPGDRPAPAATAPGPPWLAAAVGPPLATASGPPPLATGSGPPRRWAVAALVAAACFAAGGPVAALLGVAGERAARRAWRRAVAARRARAVEAALPDACHLVAAELRAGSSPDGALAAAAEAVSGPLAGILARAASASRVGVTPAALLDSADPGLRALAAVWSVAGQSGPGLADAVGRLGAGLAAERRVHAETAAQLAGARSSAVALAALPLLGIALAAAVGGDPVGFLFRTPIGAACLVAGTALDVAGVLWVRSIARGPA